MDVGNGTVYTIKTDMGNFALTSKQPRSEAVGYKPIDSHGRYIMDLYLTGFGCYTSAITRPV